MATLLIKTVLIKTLLLWLVISCLGLPVTVHADIEIERDLKVAVLAFKGREKALQRWTSTMEYLNQQLPGYSFTAVPMSLAQLDEAVIKGQVDFAITNSGQYVRVGSKYGMSWIATLKSRRHPGKKAVIGSALIVKSDSPYQTLADLEDARLGAVDPQAFGGFQIYWGEMLQRGYKPERFFSQIKFSGFPVGVLAFWVRDGLADAAVLPACTLETMVKEGLIQADTIKVLDAKQFSGFNCQTSTDLYPNWSFSALKSTPVDITEQVAQALLLLPSQSQVAIDTGSLGWTAPVSSHDIHNLYERLDIHPWQVPWWQNLRRWLLQNWQWTVAILLLLLAGLMHHIWIQFMVRKRTREIQEVNEELLHQQQQLEHAQRIAILGELSSDLAHELNQPLSAINNYAEGGVIRIDRNNDDAQISDLLSRISSEAQRGAEIIKRIRGFAKQEKMQRKDTDLTQLIRETVNLLDYEIKKYRVAVHLQLPDTPLSLFVDPIEIQQLLVNLIRNSLEAMQDQQADRHLTIQLQIQGFEQVILSISDTGPGIEDSQLENLFKAFHSSKPDGLGLGMSICKRIVEAHSGDISMMSGLGRGTVVTCTLPASPNNSPNNNPNNRTNNG
ncbi:sensor histidine kinase [Amphritea sp. HPY]|uniref:sensor histidine kinase n=1 Tax=Amphritea sp. HPY TaxID=3421652 RepID=UPI003D7DECAC